MSEKIAAAIRARDAKADATRAYYAAMSRAYRPGMTVKWRHGYHVRIAKVVKDLKNGEFFVEGVTGRQYRQPGWSFLDYAENPGPRDRP
jgi:hypothetical protein